MPFYCQVFFVYDYNTRNNLKRSNGFGWIWCNLRIDQKYFMHQLFFSVYLLKLDNSLTKHSVSGSSYFRSARRIIRLSKVPDQTVIDLSKRHFLIYPYMRVERRISPNYYKQAVARKIKELQCIRCEVGVWDK